MPIIPLTTLTILATSLFLSTQKSTLKNLRAKKINKKQGLRQDARCMKFENYAKRINAIKEIEIFHQNQPEKQKQSRFAIEENEMVLKEMEKSQFSQINDKKYYFSNEIVLFPSFQPLLHEIIHFKKEKKH